MKTIERLRGLEKAASPGPWEAPFLWDRSGLAPNNVRHAPVPGGTWKSDTEVICAFPKDILNRDNALLIAATRNALPALLAVVEAQAAEIAARRLPWRCPYCGRRYAEYVNGCPACHFGEPGTATSVTMDTDGIESLRLKTDDAIRALEGGD